MKNIFFPDEYCPSFYEYDFPKAYSDGRRLIIFDIDNTIVPHGAPADGRSIETFQRLKDMGFRLCAVSNNKEPRVKMFCDAVDVPYVFKAGKPKAEGYLEAIRICGRENAGDSKGENQKLSTAQTIFFGDQIFTDIWGANNAGIHSILVKPIDLSTDEIQIRLKRIPEKPIIKAFFKQKGIAIKEYFN